MTNLPNDVSIRLQCMDMAVRTAGNPNHLQSARSYYEFVTENLTASKNAASASDEATEATPSAPKAQQQKGQRK